MVVSTGLATRLVYIIDVALRICIKIYSLDCSEVTQTAVFVLIVNQLANALTFHTHEYIGRNNADKQAVPKKIYFLEECQ